MPMKVRYTVVDGEVVSEVRSGVRRDYVTDSLGSTIALVDGAQNVTDTWEYWPYGEVRARTGTTPTPFQFVGTLGYYRDSSRRTYVRARHYRQDLGRWLTVDPLWPALGAYEYCLSAPSQGVDPSGFYESGGAEESGGPVLFPPDDLIFKYGRYCGKENWHNDCDDGVPRPKPLDCIDSACQAHDDCLKDAASKYGSAGYWTHDGKRCHCSLYAAAVACTSGGCLVGNSRGLKGVGPCFAASALVQGAFAVLCTVTGPPGAIWGFVGRSPLWAAGQSPGRVARGTTVSAW